MKPRRLVRAAFAVAVGLVAGYLAFTYLTAVLKVTGSSMLPTVADGALVLVVRPLPAALLRASRDWAEDGDVVVLTAPDDGEKVIKRVVATGGHSVALQDGVLLLDGEALTTGPDLGRHAGHSSFASVTVPPGHVFVLGDNRLPLASRDSRDYGPVPLANLRGLVVGVR